MLLSGLAQDYTQLLICRFICGLHGGSTPVVTACIVDVVPKAQRPKYNSMFGAINGVAFIAGPVIGAFLTEFGIRVPFFAAAGMATAGGIVACFFFKESHPLILAKKKKQNEGDVGGASESTVGVAGTKSTDVVDALSVEESKGIPVQIRIISVIYFLCDECAYSGSRCTMRFLHCL